MVEITGIVGIRPRREIAASVVTPPYDVIRHGDRLWDELASREESWLHVILGNHPAVALENLLAKGIFMPDEEACYYVTLQESGFSRRYGVFAAVGVSDYSEKQIVRHEKVFDDKVQGRLELIKELGYINEPIFLLRRQSMSAELERLVKDLPVEYDIIPDFVGISDLDQVRTVVWRIPAASAAGGQVQALLAADCYYIADGHHRYHAALLGGYSHCLAYICDDAGILAYNRLITGKKPFSQIIEELNLEETLAFVTPPKNCFTIRHHGRNYLLRARQVPEDVVGKLDCSILERELYPLLGLEHSMIKQAAHFDYLSQNELQIMEQRVDAGEYDIAVALHPVSLEELYAVADAGLIDPEIVMPEKSTYFSPKLLSGLVALKV
jgi:uncharacterized protein (DUF1015 family)